MPDISRLTSYAEQQAGDQLRAVAEFEGIETNLQYLRDDLDAAAVTERLELIHDNITWSWSPPENELEEQLGQKRASLQVREDAVILYLPTGPDQGILIGLEPAAASDLTTFIGTCLEYVPDSQYQH